MALEKKEIKRLKGLAHSIKPVGRVGKEGMSEALTAAVEEALTARELIKIKFLETADFDKKNDPAQLAQRLNAEVVGIIGHTVILYRYNKDLTRHI
ncbi:YhbY family RNA-binding protein [Chitinivibrio alkaliphilus]|uniref:Putative RNA-binding protein, YhbY family n=1 Tax=Chitinivibrio alkaliphilus ACht1 TaxID=1313304 RepID=U7DAY2_9BACT|nr:YhbY family RNA-binding protein [Chitinivibrio alkaliphilus]ERP38728.1 putative RNA-binding protein, YhbY family [Chitinivibrio alkaliphilus ACht1]